MLRRIVSDNTHALSTRAGLVAHADWSVAAAKRWMTAAVAEGNAWRLRSEPVGDPGTLLARLGDAARGGAALLGVDAPVGLPWPYVERHLPGVADFPAFLAGLDPGDAFFRVCDRADEIGPLRPFYPHGVLGSPRRQAQAERLGVASPDALLRRCDRKTATRPRAASLFWTLGPNQVGKAAIALWRDMLLPALHGAARPALWPFDGGLDEVLAPHRVAVAETYPAEALRQLGLKLRGSKRRQADRRALAAELLDALACACALPDHALAAGIETGFGNDASGEDRFDSLVGLLGMLHVLAGPARATVPPDETVRRWEGWILGQPIEPPPYGAPGCTRS